MPDTSYAYFDNNVFFYLQKFENLLADSAGGIEKQDDSFGGMYVLTDSTESQEQAEQTKNKLKDFTVNSNVEKDFEFFKTILSNRNERKHYIIVFKKSFADRVYDLDGSCTLAHESFFALNDITFKSVYKKATATFSCSNHYLRVRNLGR